MKPEDKSDALDDRIVAISAREYKQANLRTALAVATLAFVIVGFVAMFATLHRIIESTNEAVRAEIPGLQEQIRQRDKTISDQQYVIEQAVEAIKKLAKQVQDLGGDPGQITISPPKSER